MIARTLGVVDHVKASTSDADASSTLVPVAVAAAVTGASAADTDTDTDTDNRERGGTGTKRLSRDVGTDMDTHIGIHDGTNAHTGTNTGAPARPSGGLASADPVRAPRAAAPGYARNARGDDGDEHGCVSETGDVRAHRPRPRPHAGRARGQSVPEAYYVAGEGSLRLAGEGVFSPAASMPPSPVAPRMPFQAGSEGDGGVGQGGEGEGNASALRRRVHGRA